MRQNRGYLSCLFAVVLFLLPARVYGSGPSVDDPSLPFRYAWVGTKDVPVYAGVDDPAQMLPVRVLPAYNTWVSIKEEIVSDQYTWYRIDENEYVLSQDVWVGALSTLHGISVGREQHTALGFALVNELNVRTRPDITAASRRKLDRYARIEILGRTVADGETWYRIGRNQYVKGDYVRIVDKVGRPDGVLPGEKWIAVNLTEQTLAAYEGDRMVYVTLVSTGLPWWQTPQGLFQIWAKIRVGNMSRTDPRAGSYYFLQDVPWAMYFDGPYALHTAYWHDGFGYPRSHGCVNLSPRDAHWLFDWTAPTLQGHGWAIRSTEEQPGTWIYVYSAPVPVAKFESWSGGQPAERGLIE